VYGGFLVLVGVVVYTAVSEPRKNQENPKIANNLHPKAEQRSTPSSGLEIPTKQSNLTFENPQNLEIISEKWKQKEKILNDDKSRPAAYQQQLEEKSPQDLVFGTAKTLSVIDGADGEKLSYTNNKENRSIQKVDGKPVTQMKYIYGEFGQLMILGFPNRTEASRIIRMQSQTEAETVDVLPRFNYHEKRRWYIDGWAWISEDLLLAISHEEDGKSEVVVKTHFYSYERRTNTLRTLVPPDEVNPYQSIEFHGINRESATIKLSDEQGRVIFLRLTASG
jgi:hypothetical protein